MSGRWARSATPCGGSLTGGPTRARAKAWARREARRESRTVERVDGVRHVAVVGGGVSGLTTAYRLTRTDGTGTAVGVTLLEADDRLGGKVAAESVGGVRVDTGPDALMVRAPAAARLIAELGLDGDLRAPSGAGAYLWSRGRLRPLPPGSVFGVPDRLWPLLGLTPPERGALGGPTPGGGYFPEKGPWASSGSEG